MFIEFKRRGEFYEDGEEGQENSAMRPRTVMVNPNMVSSVFPSTDHPNCTIIRGPDGRGMLIDEPYTSVKQKFEPTSDAR